MKRVLLIDDDIDEHDLFTEALKLYDKSITCFAATGWIQSFPLLQSFSPDVIFLDYNMPVTNGAETLRLIKQLKNLENVRVYIYSAAHNRIYAAKVLSLGAIEWIVKPKHFEEYSKIFKQIFVA
jgi:CheY-like chemotaxis protein